MAIQPASPAAPLYRPQARRARSLRAVPAVQTRHRTSRRPRRWAPRMPAAALGLPAAALGLLVAFSLLGEGAAPAAGPTDSAATLQMVLPAPAHAQGGTEAGQGQSNAEPDRHRVPANVPVEEGTVWVVARGETLWSIARSVAPDQDPRRVVDALRRSNRLTSASLRVGQTLRIPSELR